MSGKERHNFLLLTQCHPDPGKAHASDIRSGAVLQSLHPKFSAKKGLDWVGVRAHDNILSTSTISVARTCELF